jgi:hypothetical protein
MAVMVRESWTDERLDDFKESVNQRFDQVDRRFDLVEKQIVEVKGEVKELRQTMIQGFSSWSESRQRALSPSPV